MINRLLCLACLLPASAALSHHSVSAYFDTSRAIEIRGQLTDVRWRNPHVGFTIKTRDDNGAETIWDVSSTSLSHLSRFGLSADLFIIGETVTVVGAPSKQPAAALQATNMLLPDGREIVLNAAGTRHWLAGSEERLRVTDIDARDDGDARRDRSLFRVWSTLTYDREQDRLWEDSYPLTEQARAAQIAWDPLTDNPVANCVQKGMPAVMNPPYPMELVDQGDIIVLRQEEFDSERTIYLNSATTPEPEPSTMGHSVGRWEDDTLVVETTHGTWPYFDGTGIPLSGQAEFEERFTVSADGKRLNYTILINDPATFTEPLLLDRFWLWIPGARIKPYDCRE